jgi:hypothetical protein
LASRFQSWPGKGSLAKVGAGERFRLTAKIRVSAEDSLCINWVEHDFQHQPVVDVRNQSSLARDFQPSHQLRTPCAGFGHNRRPTPDECITALQLERYGDSKAGGTRDKPWKALSAIRRKDFMHSSQQ